MRRIVIGRTAPSAILVVALSLGSCTEPNPPDVGAPGLRVLPGAGQADTIESLLDAPLVIELRDVDGLPVVGASIRFLTGTSRILVGPPDLLSPLHDATTDARGRASTRVGFGRIAGPATVRIFRRPSELFAADSAVATYTVLAGNVAKVLLPVADSTVYVNNGYQLRATLADRFDNPRSGALTYEALAPAVALVDGAGQVTGLQIGRAGVRVSGAGFTDTAWVTVPPAGMIAANAVLGNAFLLSAPGLVTVALDGSQYRRIGPSGNHPEWIASGDSILYERSNRLRMLDTLGIVDRLFVTSGSTTAETRASVSADGQWLFFNHGDGGCALYRARPDGSEVTPFLGPCVGTWASSSPDGAEASVWRGGEIAILDVATITTQTILPSCQCLSTNYPARWSPDGTTLAFVRDTVLFLTTPTGASPTALTPDTAAFEPVEFDWAPDSQWIVARRHNGLDLIRVSDGLRLPLGWSLPMREPAWRP